MATVVLEQQSVVIGSKLRVRVLETGAAKFPQVSFDVIAAATLNPTWRLSAGSPIKVINDDEFEFEIDTQHLSAGKFELSSISLLHPTDENRQSDRQISVARDSNRCVFEVVVSVDALRPGVDILAEIVREEHRIEADFCAPVDIRPSPQDASEIYGVMVFVRDVLMGARIRFKGFEILPTGSGLDSKGEFEFINWFLTSHTGFQGSFAYGEEQKSAAKHSNPVFVVHFPTLVASSPESAYQYSVEKVNDLLLALALARDAGGVVFSAVVLEPGKGKARLFSQPSHYVGNLILGTGESEEQLTAYADGLKTDPLNSFLVGLYKEARREKSRDFQYVRLWQILETMADSQNYDATKTLLDFDGNVIMDGPNPRLCKGSVPVVFTLVRENGMGKKDETWKNVNVWFAFRNAVAHHGAISRYGELDRATVRQWAELAVNEISKGPGIDNYLQELKEQVKLILMRRLTAHLRTNP